MFVGGAIRWSSGLTCDEVLGDYPDLERDDLVAALEYGALASGGQQLHREFIRGPLAENPQRVGKPLRGQLEGRYSARRGEFRVIYRIFDGRVVVRAIHIAHRRDIYR